MEIWITKVLGFNLSENFHITWFELGVLNLCYLQIQSNRLLKFG